MKCEDLPHPRWPRGGMGRRGLPCGMWLEAKAKTRETGENLDVKCLWGEQLARGRRQGNVG